MRRYFEFAKDELSVEFAAKVQPSLGELGIQGGADHRESPFVFQETLHFAHRVQSSEVRREQFLLLGE